MVVLGWCSTITKMSCLQWLVTVICLLALPEQIHNCHPAPATTSAAAAKGVGTAAPTAAPVTAAPVAEAAATAGCTTCTVALLSDLTLADAVSGRPPQSPGTFTAASGNMAVSVSRPPTITAGNVAGCASLSFSCLPGEAAFIHVVLASDPTKGDFGVSAFTAGTTTSTYNLVCNGAGKYVLDPNTPAGSIPGLCPTVPTPSATANCQVDGFTCVKTINSPNGG